MQPHISLVIVAVWLVVACAPTAPPAAAPAPAPAAGAASGSAAAPAPAASAPAASAPATIAVEPLSPPRQVRFLSTGIAAQAPTYLAIERGYFREVGIEPEIIPMAATNDAITLLNGDQLDVAAQAVSPAFFNAVARGVGIRMVADHGTTLPGRSTPSLAVHTDVLAQKPWAGYQDLKGLRVGLQAPVGVEAYLLEQMLARGGLDSGDVEIVTPIPFPDMVAAFNNKAIEASIYNEPWATQLEQLNVLKKVAYADDVANVHISGLLYSEPFAREARVGRNFMVAYLRGVRDYWDAYDGRLDFQYVVDVIQKYTALKDEALIRKLPPTGQNPNGYLDPVKLTSYQDWLADRGLVTQKADIKVAYDPAFADYANSVLGPYRPAETPRRPS